MMYDQDADGPFYWHREPYRTNPIRKYSRLLQLVFMSMLMTVMLIWLIVAAAGASSVRPGCGYTIMPGDTLTGIGNRYSVPVDVLVEVNDIKDPDVIYAGHTIDRCAAAVTDGRRPALSTPPELPGHAQAWAQAVRDMRPDWATDDDVRFMVAIAGPESGFGRWLWNPGDANNSFTGSYGVVQIRILREPDDYDWFRNREWLEQSYDNQAEAAWIVYGRQGKGAWGPWTRKLHTDCGTVPQRWQQSCVEWWNIAEQALNRTH